MRVGTNPIGLVSAAEDPALLCVARWRNARALREASWKTFESTPGDAVAYEAYEAADMAMWAAEDNVFQVQPTTMDGALAVLTFISVFVDRRLQASFVPKPIGEAIRRAVAVLKTEIARNEEVSFD
jgi:hypothetical protein